MFFKFTTATVSLFTHHFKNEEDEQVISFEVTSVSKAEYFTSKTFLILRPTHIRWTEEIFIGKEPLRRNMRELSTALPGAEDGSLTLVHVMSIH